MRVQCPCGGSKNYLDCCGKYVEGRQIPATPEALMRSRYTAYSMADVEYIKKTMHGKPLIGFDALKARRWAEKAVWVGLQVVKAFDKDEQIGYVEFIAQYVEGNQLKSIHETSEFHREQAAWFYVDGIQKSTNNKTVSRNMACPCGSQKKFKNCHAGKKTQE